jgi:hypothetical protein
MIRFVQKLDMSLLAPDKSKIYKNPEENVALPQQSIYSTAEYIQG